MNLHGGGLIGWSLQGTPVNIIVGSHVWAEDPEDAWIDGEVKEIKGRDATIVTTNGKTVSHYIYIFLISHNKGIEKEPSFIIYQ